MASLVSHDSPGSRITAARSPATTNADGQPRPAPFRSRCRVLARRPCTIRFDFDFAYDGGGRGKVGTGTLSLNDKRVAGGRIEKTVPVVFSTVDTFDVGADWGTPVSPTYQPPFEFTGTLEQVTVEAK